MVGGFGFLFGYHQFPFHQFHFCDVPFYVQQDGGEVFALYFHFPLVQEKRISMTVTFFCNPVHLLSGGGYIFVLSAFLTGYFERIEIEVVFAQSLFHRDVTVVRFTIAVQVFEVVPDIFHNNSCGQMLHGFVQYLVEPLDLLFVADAL